MKKNFANVLLHSIPGLRVQEVLAFEHRRRDRCPASPVIDRNRGQLAIRAKTLSEKSHISVWPLRTRTRNDTISG